jgi:glycosyltransferase involved in cell wall biosynthesis
MISPKTFVLATNDGSRADELYALLGIGKKKFSFFFWRSGVCIPPERPMPDPGDPADYPASYDPMALSMIGRVADVKRQDRAVRILGELHRRGRPFHLYLIGTVASERMYQAALEAADACGVRDYVHFVGGKSQKECRMYARNSLATLLPCEWNRLNIFYEAMGEGALVLTNDNHSVDEFIRDGENCLVYDEDDFSQAAEKINAISGDSALMERIREGAHETARKSFLSLEKRFGMEADLVEAAAAGKDMDRFPPVL